MKKFYQIALLSMLLIGFASCEKDKFGESIFIDPVVDTTAYSYPFDQWLHKYYTIPYNVEFRYRLDDSGTDPNYNVVPVSMSKADTIAHLALYLWYDVYDSVAVPGFLHDNGPRIIQLIGSAMINAAQGTEKLGQAEGGIKITLMKINLMQTDNIDQLNEYIFKTMHHEFSHILHQKKTMPKEFEQISAADYNPDGWQYTTETEAWQLGFASPYGSSQAREDFVEIIANYIVKSDAQIEKMLTVAGQDGKKGRAVLTQKIEICREWLADRWDLNLDELRAEVQKRQNNMDWDMIMSLGFLHEQK